MSEKRARSPAVLTPGNLERSGATEQKRDVAQWLREDSGRDDVGAVTERFLLAEVQGSASRATIGHFLTVLRQRMRTPEDARAFIGALERRMKEDLDTNTSNMLPNFYVLDAVLKAFRADHDLAVVLQSTLLRLVQAYLPWSEATKREMERFRRMFNTWRTSIPAPLLQELMDLLRVTTED